MDSELASAVGYVGRGSVCLCVVASVELAVFHKRRPTNCMRNQKKMAFRNMKGNVRGTMRGLEVISSKERWGCCFSLLVSCNDLTFTVS